MNIHLELLAQIFEITTPVFSMVVIGMLLKRVGLINDDFISSASTLVYKATMPTLLFFSISRVDLTTQLDPKLIGLFCLATVFTLVVSWLIASRWVPPSQKAVFIQATFRGNAGIVSLALAANLYGAYGLSIGGILAGVTAILYNSMSTVVFAVCTPQFQPRPSKIAKDILLNPMIVGVSLGVIASISRLSFPTWLTEPGNYFASLSLPLALICVGGAMSPMGLFRVGWVATHASLIKLVWMPLAFTAIGWYAGLQGRELGTLFLFLASPTAAVSYVMARISGGDSTLAASIIVITTLGAMASITTGLYFLGLFGLI